MVCWPGRPPARCRPVRRKRRRLRDPLGFAGVIIAAASMAKVARIYLRPGSRLPVREVAAATAVAGEGLCGDHAGGGRRQVTILDQQCWDDVCRELGQELDPGARRANLVLEGLDLRDRRGQRLRIGAALFEVLGETRPCALMDDACQGLGAALDPDWRGGVFSRVLEGGEIRVGDPVDVVSRRRPADPEEFDGL